MKTENIDLDSSFAHKGGEIISENICYYPHEFLLSPFEVSPFEVRTVEVRTVLVSGDIGDYAAYTGIGSQEFVKRLGNKISFEEAKIHFPLGLKEENYRR